MDDLFYLKTGKPHIQPGQWVIKAATYTKAWSVFKAQAEARKSAEQIMSKAQYVYDTRFEEGYQDGLAQAKQEFAEQLIHISGESALFLSAIEDRVVDTVVTAVQMILHQTKDEQIIKASAVTAVQSLKDVKQMTLRVSRQQCPNVEQFIDELRREHNAEWIEIVADDHLKNSDCILETPFGVVDAGLETQLRMLKKYLKSKLEKERPAE